MAKPNLDVDKNNLSDAKTMWFKFTNLIKVSSLATALLLLAMLIFIY